MRLSGLIVIACVALAYALTPCYAKNPAAPLQKLPAAQKVILSEEDPHNPNGIGFVGGVVWWTERLPRGVGQAPEIVIRGDIDIPDQKISVSLTLRHNDDKQLPASHTVDIEFRLPPGFSHRNIFKLPQIMANDGEATRGFALNGASVKVMGKDNFFLVGLSATDADMQRNVEPSRTSPGWVSGWITPTARAPISPLRRVPPVSAPSRMPLRHGSRRSAGATRAGSSPYTVARSRFLNPPTVTSPTRRTAGR